MNWEAVAIEDLKKYKAMKEGLLNTAEKIKALREKSIAIKNSSTSAVPVKGGGNRVEGRLLDNIVERERLKYTYRANEHLVKIIERGLSGLSSDERFILDTFYINRCGNHIERCIDKLHVEQSQVYRMKDKALYKFTVSMYGIIDY